MMEIEEEKRPHIICRFCLTVAESYEVLSGSQEDMVQIVVPELNLEICKESYICYECSGALQETFSFKSTCLEIEDTIHNYTNKGQVQINLDKLTGLKDLQINDKIEKQSKMCRTCLNIAEPLSYIKLNSESPEELEMLENKLPEVNITLTQDPIMCHKCQNLLKKYVNFHKTAMTSENRINSYLHQSSTYLKKNFELNTLFESPVEVDDQLVHDEINIDDGEMESKHVINNLNNVQVESKFSKSLEVINERNKSTLANNPTKDKLLDELDTAIMSCGQNESLSKEISQEELEALIEEVSESSDGNQHKISEKSKKPYNTRNKRRKIIIDTITDNFESDPDFSEPFEDDSDDDDYVEGSENFGWVPKNRVSNDPGVIYNTRNKRRKIRKDPIEDNVAPDPDFPEPLEDDSDDDYVEGSEKFGWLPKSRKSHKDASPKGSATQKLKTSSPKVSGTQKVPCKFCHKPISSALIIPHLVMCTKNPKNQRLVECAHCGVIVFSMQRLQQHMANCKEYADWKLKNDSLDLLGSKMQENQVQQTIIVLNVGNQNVHEQSNQSDGKGLKTIPLHSIPSGIGKILSVTSVADEYLNANKEKKDVQEKIGDSGIEENESQPLVADSSIANIVHGIETTSSEVQIEQNVGVTHVKGGNDRDTISIPSRNDQENLTSKDSMKLNTDTVVESDQTNPATDTTTSTIEDTGSVDVPGNEKVITKEKVLMRTDEENETVTSSTDGVNSEVLPTASPAQHNLERSSEESEIIFISESTPYGFRTTSTPITTTDDVQKTMADSSNTIIPSYPRRSDITMIDYMKSELLRMSTSIIDDLSSQFLGVLKCNKCSYNTRHLSNMENHVVTHFTEPKQNENYFCVLCHKLQLGLYNFIDHMKTEHRYAFYTPFYWCVKCALILCDIKQIHLHECPKKTDTVKIFRSNGVVFCMACKFESENVLEVKQHLKLCALRTSSLDPTEVIVIDDDD